MALLNRQIVYESEMQGQIIKEQDARRCWLWDLNLENMMTYSFWFSSPEEPPRDPRDHAHPPDVRRIIVVAQRQRSASGTTLASKAKVQYSRNPRPQIVYITSASLWSIAFSPTQRLFDGSWSSDNQPTDTSGVRCSNRHFMCFEYHDSSSPCAAPTRKPI
nr:hypothetical protein CFP56_62497 [Quercus suber]